MAKFELLTVDGNPKVIKGDKGGAYLTGILHLAPADVSVPFGGFNTCSHASAGCRLSCLNKAGRGGIPQNGRTDGHANSIEAARVRKTVWFLRDRAGFLAALVRDIRKLVKLAEKRGAAPALRLNGTSDLRWERIAVDGAPNLMSMFPNVQFYDYTAIPARVTPENYHLTFSRKETTTDETVRMVASTGQSVAVPFAVRKGQPLPAFYLGLPVFDADETDLRFLDPRGAIAGLRAKGPARKDRSGFVVNA